MTGDSKMGGAWERREIGEVAMGSRETSTPPSSGRAAEEPNPR